MIEIRSGTIDERILKLLQKFYPITVNDIQYKLKLSKLVVSRSLKKLQVKGIVRLEPLSDKTYVRLLRNDLSYVKSRRQRKFIKHHIKDEKPQNDEYNGIMFT